MALLQRLQFQLSEFFHLGIAAAFTQQRPRLFPFLENVLQAGVVDDQRFKARALFGHRLQALRI